jgi:hypothetical protein
MTEPFRYRISWHAMWTLLPVRVSQDQPRGSLVIAVNSPLVGNLTQVELQPVIPPGLTCPPRACTNRPLRMLSHLFSKLALPGKAPGLRTT